MHQEREVHFTWTLAPENCSEPSSSRTLIQKSLLHGTGQESWEPLTSTLSESPSAPKIMGPCMAQGGDTPTPHWA